MTAPQKQWSKEPWTVDKNDIQSNGFTIGCLTGPTKEEAESNAARIVACVNFCAGLTTEDFDKYENAKAEIFYQMECVRQLKSQLASLTQQAEANKDGWISVDERLPRLGFFVQIWVKGKNLPYIGMLMSEAQHWVDEHLYDLDLYVTHWKPLPPPPLSQPSPVEAQEKSEKTL